MDREIFAQYIKDALANLHSPVRMLSSPLTDLLFESPPEDRTKARALREALCDAVASLCPADADAGSPSLLAYRLLQQRYINCQSRVQTCEDLGISQATYYRLHNDAITAVSSVLWERMERSRQASDDRDGHDASELGPEQRAREEAIRFAQQGESVWFDLDGVLDGVIDIIHPLAERYRVRLDIAELGTIPRLYGDPLVLRQAALNVLTAGLTAASADAETAALEFSYRSVGNRIIFRLGPLSREKTIDRHLTDTTGFAVAEGVLQASGGHLCFIDDATAGCLLQFDLPISPSKTVLIIDDDEPTTQLYRRYLQAYDYELIVARSGEEAWALLAEWRPDQILLDVLMPREDGWDILQQLKTLPETADIPVVICSVLLQPQLALVLGAERVLSKPITEEALVGLLQEITGAEGTADRSYPATPASSVRR